MDSEIWKLVTFTYVLEWTQPGTRQSPKSTRQRLCQVLSTANKADMATEVSAKACLPRAPCRALDKVFAECLKGSRQKKYGDSQVTKMETLSSAMTARHSAKLYTLPSISRNALGKALSFAECFYDTRPYKWRSFVGASEGMTCPYKSTSRGGSALSPSLKIPDKSFQTPSSSR